MDPISRDEALRKIRELGLNVGRLEASDPTDICFTRFLLPLPDARFEPLHRRTVDPLALAVAA